MRISANVLALPSKACGMPACAKEQQDGLDRVQAGKQPHVPLKYAACLIGL